MDWLQFSSSIFQSLVSLAWPVAFVMAVVLFRTEIRKLLPNLRVKHADWEASFRLEKAEKEAAELPGEPTVVPPEAVPTPEEIDRFEQIAQLSPRAAIMEQRRALEEAVLKRLAEVPNTPSGRVSIQTALRFLRRKDQIDKHTSAVLDDLINIGNEAAHNHVSEREFTKEEAMRYRKLAEQVIAQLSFG
jgi:hypothetical protein